MSALFFALLTSFLVGFGGKDQRLVAHLREGFGPSLPLLIVAILSSCLSAGVAVWFGGMLGRDMSEDAATMFVAIALLLAGVELLLPMRSRLPAEPTRSAPATFLALFAGQLTDAARFVIVALAIVLPAPIVLGIGGALGGAAAVTLAWSAPALFRDAGRVRRVRLGLAVPILMFAVWAALRARGIVA